LEKRISIAFVEHTIDIDRLVMRRAVTAPGLLSSWTEFVMMTMQDMEDEEELPYISGSGEGLMEEGPALHAGARRNEDIALDLMKFVAMTTGYGRTTSSGVGFQGTGSAAKPEEYATHLLELYGKCLAAVGKK
jgi:hypothetical protein